MEFCKITPGSFEMGCEQTSDISELTQQTGGGVLSFESIVAMKNQPLFVSMDERPAHTVTLGRAIYMGRYEVTQAQWFAVMGTNPSHFKGRQLPVESVSVDECLSFCLAMSKHVGQTVRLPSEAEWEYACRSGTTGHWSFGDDVTDLSRYAWFFENSKKQTHPVGFRDSNPWGFHDMYGNVSEWCQDHWHDSYKGAPSDGSAWCDQAKGTITCVRRGGCFLSVAGMCRSSKRDILAVSEGYSNPVPVIREPITGFRVVVEASKGGR